LATRRIVVGPAEAGQRLDRLVARNVKVGRRQVRDLCEAGRVRIDGKKARPADPLAAGAVVELEPFDDRAEPDASLTLDVRLETSSVIVVHKKAGEPTAPLRPGELGTLANALVARYPEVAGIGRRPREPGLVHRLDTETSGLVVACRKADAFRRLSDALVAGRLEKRYLAIAADTELAGAGSIDAALAPDPRRRGRVLAVGPGARGYSRPSLTHYRVLERHGALVLVELRMSRGFRHQIRAHLAELGAPLVGDVLYGGRPWPEHPKRHALHASYVAWAGDATLEGFAVEAEMPADMRGLFAG
jgi:23S rRNA pseudouridine1911/1915/1917 synthase